MAQPTARSAKNTWPVFKGHYQQIVYFYGHFRGVPLQGDKLAAEPLIRQISEDWARIQTDHPDDHVRLKIELRKAIRLYKVEAQASARAMRRLQSLCEQNRAADPRVNDTPEIYERAMLAGIRCLVAAKNLALIEGEIGPAAAYIRDHVEEEIRETKREIEKLGEAVAYWTRKLEQPNDEEEDQDPNEQARAMRRAQYQFDTGPIPRPGGPGRNMWYGLLADGTLACIGLWLFDDEHGNIVERVIMKDVWYTELCPFWTDPTWWLQDPRDPTVKIPPEASIMAHLTRTGQNNVVRLRDWQLFPTKLMYRVGHLPHSEHVLFPGHILTCLSCSWNTALFKMRQD
jgi:hypothetical protein